MSGPKGELPGTPPRKVQDAPPPIPPRPTEGGGMYRIPARDEPTQCGECGRPMRDWDELKHHFVAVHVFHTEPDDYRRPEPERWPDAHVVRFRKATQ